MVGHLERSMYSTKCLHIAAKNRLEGETISRYWTQLNKEKTPRDTIQMLKYPGTDPPIFERKSQKMAELARNYHHDLQTQGMCTGDQLNAARTVAYDNIDTGTTPEDKQILALRLKEEEIILALKQLPNGKAAGMDGIPCELWKSLHNQYEQSDDHEKPKLNVAKLLTLVYNDIEKFEVSPNTNFSLGWLCPIYKKGDKREISNYRPITILNVDYKLLTKALNNKLAKTISKLIPRD
jgi:hypothetical protein